MGKYTSGLRDCYGSMTVCTVIDYEHSLLLESIAPVKKKSRAKKRAPPKALGAPLIVCDLHHTYTTIMLLLKVTLNEIL